MRRETPPPSISRGSAVEFFAGAAYNITPEFSVGVEFNNEGDFDGLFGNSHNGTNAFFFGPTVSYVGLPFVVRVGTQLQLPWANAHSNAPGTIAGGYLTEDERMRVGMRVSMDVP